MTACPRPHSAIIRVLAADDHTVMRAGIADIVNREPDLELIGAACDGAEAMKLYTALAPDVVLMDLRMPGLGGIAAIKGIRRADPDARILVLTSFDGDADIHEALSAGARRYLRKDVGADALVRAIRAVAGGSRAVPVAIALALADHTPRRPLSRRELEVLRLVAKGLPNKGVARAIGRTDGTAKLVITHILAKLGVNDRTAAVTAALRRGIIHLDD